MDNATSKALILLICVFLASAQTQNVRGRVQSLVDNPSLLPSCPNCCSDKTISVGGSAVVEGIPDKARLNAQITVSGDTVDQAIERLALKVNQVISRLQSNGLTVANYQSTSVNVYANTSWNNGVSTILGQIADQNIAIEIPQITANGSNIGRLIDSLAQVDGIRINSLTFDIKDKTPYFETARERAFRQAQRKAEDYAQFLSLNLAKVLSVEDSYSSVPVVQNFQAQPKVMALSMRSDQAQSQATNVNLGTIKINYYLNAVYSYI